MKKDTEGRIVRAVALPILKPVDATWDDFGTALRAAWQESTALANWGMTELAKADVARTADMSKLPPMPKINLYELFTGIKGQPKKGKRGPRERAGTGYCGLVAWEGCKQGAAAVLRKVDQAYRQARFNIVWRRSQSLPSFTYPFPYPVSNQNWRVCMDDGPVVHLALSGRRWALRLKSGRDFARQVAKVQQIADGTAVQGALSIYQKGFREKHVMMALIGRFPEPVARDGLTMTLKTDPAAFWVADIPGRAPWIINADHLRRWHASEQKDKAWDIRQDMENHRVFLQRISEDTKYEKRLSRRAKRNIAKARQLRCEKHDNRMATWLSETVACLVKYAVRTNVGMVSYDDSCQEYLSAFRWFELRTRLASKLEEVGIAFTHDTKGSEDVA